MKLDLKNSLLPELQNREKIDPLTLQEEFGYPLSRAFTVWAELRDDGIVDEAGSIQKDVLTKILKERGLL